MYKQLFLLMLSCCFASQSLLAEQCPDLTVTSFDPLTVTIVNPPDESKNWKVTTHPIDPTFLSEWKTTVLSRFAAEATWTTVQRVDPKLISAWTADLIAKGTDPKLIDKAIQDRTNEYRLLQDLTVYESLVATAKMDNPNKVVNVPLDYCLYGLISKKLIQYGDPQKKLYYMNSFFTRVYDKKPDIEFSLIELRPITTKNISLDSILNNNQVWPKKNNRDNKWFHLEHDKENADPDYNATKIWYECSHNDPEIIRGSYTKCHWKEDSD